MDVFFIVCTFFHDSFSIGFITTYIIAFDSLQMYEMRASSKLSTYLSSLTFWLVAIARLATI